MKEWRAEGLFLMCGTVLGLGALVALGLTLSQASVFMALCVAFVAGFEYLRRQIE